MIVFLVWLWISNLAILLGAEFDAELEHERAIREGVSPDTDLFVVARDTRKLNDDDKLQAERAAAIRERSREDQDSTSTPPS